MNKIIEFFKALIAKTGKTAQTDVIVKTEQKSEEVQTSQNTEVDSLKSTETVKKTADSVNTEKKTTKRRGRPRKVKAE
jgi:fibronectin type 3 domain-containing protein